MARGRRKLKKPVWRKIIGWSLALVLIIGLGGASFAWYAKNDLENNIETVETIKDYPRPEKLPEFAGALNILVMGSDSREGENGKGIGGETPGLSDTAMILHISSNRKFAYGVSIPRDSMVERPECPLKDGGGTAPAELAMFNTAYAVGGPACTVKTVETLTNVPIDHFMVIDFSGFKDIVDTVGGVEICVPAPVNDPIGNIYLEGGTYVADGDTALDYVRVRHGIGAELGDIGRMKRQQTFASSLIEKVLADGIIENPVQTYKLAGDVTKSLTTDENFADLSKLTSLAMDLKKIGVKNISFVTVPFETYIPDPNRLIWSDDASIVWNAMTHDQKLTPKILAEAVRPEAAGKPNNNRPPKQPSVTSQANGLC